ncbi:transposase [Bacillus paranthracis]|uniref:Transposase n=1 Tax=Bacillus paranthracis TaxID=2026186 RepID=A0AAJ1NK02_9BACI|nr:transposase [Bacillus paranthracis]MDG0949522.1 transposase [Bacillus paranthracis]MDG0955354.1 transposase [Bacillus paranthracis]
MGVTIKIMKYQILCPMNVDWTIFEKHLRNLTYQVRTISNRTIQQLWEFDALSFDYFKARGKYPTVQDLYGCTQKKIDGYIYHTLQSKYPDIHKGNMSTTLQKIIKTWKSRRNEIRKGEMSIPSFRNRIPIDLHNNSVDITKEKNGDYIAGISLFSRDFHKENSDVPKGKIFVKLATKKQKSMKVILDRLMNQTYSKGACMIHKYKNKWYLSITYKFNAIKENNFDKELIMGIDMGGINTVYFAFNEGFIRSNIKSDEIKAFNEKIRQRRINLLKQSNYCSNSRTGKGRAKRLQPIDVLSNKIAKFRNSTNHKYANYIIKQCLKHNCGRIQIELLKGISKNDKVLKDWTYFDLQEKIKNQAEVHGIEVIKVASAYTSQRCSQCGYICKENRCTQAVFECKQCGYKTHADYNAAKNIATYDIENIINKQLAVQSKLHSKKCMDEYIEELGYLD